MIIKKVSVNSDGYHDKYYKTDLMGNPEREDRFIRLSEMPDYCATG